MAAALPEGLPLRPITAEEYPAWVTAVVRQFGETLQDADIDAYRGIVELDRTLAVFDGNQIVATAAVESLTIGVPGADPVACAGVTAVGVASTHRRRGLLRTMMRRQLDDIAQRGTEAVAALYAAEAPIYGRFGYGAAAPAVRFQVDRAWAGMRRMGETSGRMRLIDVDDAGKWLPGIYERVQASQPGMVNRTPGRWDLSVRHDPEGEREGFTPRYVALLEDRGYVVYRLRMRQRRGVPDGTLRIEELVAVDDEALALLWQYCFSVDLVARVEADRRPLDDPLPLLLVDSARAWTTMCDPLYVRLVDVPRALGARRYATGGSIVLEVRDLFCPSNSGRWLLDVAADGAAECTRTRRVADLSLDVRELGAVYLGGVRLRALARAGLVSEHRAAALRRADGLFGSDRLAWNPTEF